MILIDRTPVQATRDRVLWDIQGAGRGPLVVALGAIHGNEPAGLEAIDQVGRWLAEHPTQFRGRLVGLTGNLAALAAKVRYVDVDLNRMWQPSFRERPEVAGFSEMAEFRELDRILTELMNEGPMVLLDFHSFSATGSPFSIASIAEMRRGLTWDLPFPTILGLDALVEGPLGPFVERAGQRALTFEGGSHDDRETVTNMVFYLFHCLVRLGCLERAPMPQSIRDDSQLPKAVRVDYRYALEPGDVFVMRPGFRNFDWVDQGDLLAHDARGPVTAPHSGRLLMPLYQKLGRDGFFIGREVDPATL